MARLTKVKDRSGGGLLRSERGAVSVSGLLALAAVVALLYAVFGAKTGDPDRYGRIPIPATAVVSLPTEEADISYVEPLQPDGSALPPPSDLRIVVRDPVSREAVQVNSKAEDASVELGEVTTPIARVDAPGAGDYEVVVTSLQAASRTSPQLAFGLSPIGAVGDRFSRIGELITGPAGIAAGALLLAALVAPRFQRALRSARR